MVIQGPNHFHPSGTPLVGNLSCWAERCFIRSLLLFDDFSCPSFPLYFHGDYSPIRTSLVAQMVKNLPPVWETWVWSLGQEDPLEKRMATHSSILGWRIPWREEPCRLQSMGSQRGCLMSSGSIHKLYCGIYSTFKWSFDEIVWGGKSSPRPTPQQSWLLSCGSFLGVRYKRSCRYS